MLARALLLPDRAELTAGLGVGVIEGDKVRRGLVLFAELVEEILAADVLLSGGDDVLGVAVFHDLLAHGMPLGGERAFRSPGHTLLWAPHGRSPAVHGYVTATCVPREHFKVL
jgi:hypothetical protein